MAREGLNVRDDGSRGLNPIPAGCWCQPIPAGGGAIWPPPIFLGTEIKIRGFFEPGI